MTLAIIRPASPATPAVAGQAVVKIEGADQLEPYLAAARLIAGQATDALQAIESFESGDPSQRLLGYRSAKTGNYTATQADNGYVIPLTTAAAHIVTLPSAAGVEPGTQIGLYRAPGAGTVAIAGLTAGGISHPVDHASVDINGSVVCTAIPALAGVNGGLPYWALTGQTLP